MSLRKAALFLVISSIYIAPLSAAYASSDSADKMCSPYYAECGCDQIPDPKNPGKCIKQAPQGELPHSNVHGCGVGTCIDTTNGHTTSGICSGPNKCLGELCDGKPCAGQPDGAPGNNGSTPTQKPAQTPTIQNTAPPGTGLNQNSSILDAAKSGVYSLPLPQTGDVNWPAPPTGDNPSASGIDQIANQPSTNGADNSQIPTTVDQAAQQWTGYGESTLGPVQSLTPSGEPQTSLGNTPVNTLNFNSETTGFGSTNSGQSEGDFWNQVGDTIKGFGQPVSDFVDNIKAAYSENDGYKFTDSANLTAYGVCVGLSDGCNAMEGAPTTYQSHLDANGNKTNDIYTLNDYADGKVPYVTVASGRDSLGDTGVIDKITYNDPVTGEQKTLYDVPYQVADTGGVKTFPDGTSKMDVPLTVPESMYGNDKAINSLLDDQPFSGTKALVASTDSIAPPGPQFATNPYGVTLADLNNTPGYGGTSINGYSDFNSGGATSPSFASQPTQFTNAVENTSPLDVASAEQYLKNLPLPEPIGISPQESVWNDVMKNAQISAAENLNGFYDKVSSIFTPAPNAPIGDSLPTEFTYNGPTNDNVFNTSNNAQPFEWTSDSNTVASNGTNAADTQALNAADEQAQLALRLEQADAETAQYQNDLLAAESKIPMPEMAQVTPEQITKEVVDNNVPMPEIAHTNPQQTVELANESKYTLSNEGDLRGEFLADPVTAALLPDSMKGKLTDATENGAQTVTFTQSELDGIQWDKANINQATKLENLLAQAGYERTDGVVNDREPGIGDIAALQQIAQDKNSVTIGLASQPTELSGGEAPPSPSLLDKMSSGISSAWNDFSNAAQNYALNREFSSLPSPEVSQSGEQVTQSVLDAAQQDSQITSPQQRLEEAFNVTQNNGGGVTPEQTLLNNFLSNNPQFDPFANQPSNQPANQDQVAQNSADESSPPIQNPPLPQERPNIFAYDTDSGIGKSGVDALVKQLPATKDLDSASQAQAADAIRNALVDNPDVAKQLLGTNGNVVKGGDVVFPDKGTLNLSALNDEYFQDSLKDNINTYEKTLSYNLGTAGEVDSFVSTIGQNGNPDDIAAQNPVSQDQAMQDVASQIGAYEQKSEIANAQAYAPADNGVKDANPEMQGGSNAGGSSQESTQTGQKADTNTGDTAQNTPNCASESCVGGELGDSRARPLTDQQQALQDKIDQQNKTLTNMQGDYKDAVELKKDIADTKTSLPDIRAGLTELNKAINSWGALGDKGVMANGLSEAKSLAQDLRDYGNPDLANKIAAYAASVPQINSLGGAQSALNTGNSLVSQASVYLNSQSQAAQVTINQYNSLQNQITTNTNQLSQLTVQQAQILAPTVPSNWSQGLYTPAQVLPSGVPPSITSIASK